MVRVRGVFGVLAAAALFLSLSLSLSLPSATAVAQYIPNEPVAPLEDEWRALIGSDWSRFQMLPNSFRYDGTGHGGFEFVGALTDTPLFDGRAIERVEGVMFLQCPTRWPRSCRCASSTLMAIGSPCRCPSDRASNSCLRHRVERSTS